MRVNEIGRELHFHSNDICGLRDRLNPIAEGTIQKGRNIDRYALRPEFRKTTLKDARQICEFVIKQLNIEINAIGDLSLELLVIKELATTNKSGSDKE